jgi:hypothetical protein
LKKLIIVDCQEWDSFHYRKALDPLIRYSLLQQVQGEWPRQMQRSTAEPAKRR